MPQPRLLAVLLTSFLSVAASSCGGDAFEQAPAQSDPDASGQKDSSTDSELDQSADQSADQSTDSAIDQGTDQKSDQSPDSGAQDGSQDVVQEKKLLENGAQCQQSEECQSAVCADGVCCNQECKGCMACNLNPGAGTCQPVPIDQDPHDACKGTSGTCSGKCDGVSACAWPGQTASCGAPSCGTGNTVSRPYCDGSGACVPKQEKCENYQCEAATSTCFASCSPGNETTHCTPQSYCKGQLCVPKLAKGANCAQNGDCLTNNCVDQVCCDAACNGICESCSITGKEGSCSAIAKGADPQTECAGKDLGCGGSCDGNRKCEYAPTTSPCKDTSCGADNAVHSFHCNGLGGCVESSLACGLFACETNACESQCTADTSCAQAAYCDVGLSICAAKQTNATACGFDSQCSSGHCLVTKTGSKCCATACTSPMDCSTGACRCDGVSCSIGISCFAFYEDSDHDGFGNPNKAVAACENLVPVNYVKNSDDCDDTDARAKPGQTEFFTTARTGGGWDFNCDKKDEQEWPSVESSATCINCGWMSGTNCFKCNSFTPVATYSFGCAGLCAVGIKTAFKQNVACGGNATLYGCNPTPGVCTTDQSAKAGTPQGCR